MFHKEKQNGEEIKAYKQKIQEFNQKKWDEPIEIEELIFSNYECADGICKKELIFVDTEFDLDWLNANPLSDKALHLVNDIMVMTSLPYKHFSKEKKLAFLRILGQGIVAAFSENEEDVKKCREQATSFHKLIALDKYKRLRLQISTLLFIVLLHIFIILINAIHCKDMFFFSALWGLVGAYLSICYKTGKNDFSYSINQSFILWDTVSRFVIGTIFGIIAYYLTISVFSSMDSWIRTKEGIAILALIAGFSEKLIPNLLGKYENKFFKGE